MAVQERDLFIHRRAKLLEWVQDTKNVYEMANLSGIDCLKTMLFILISTVAGLCIKTGFEKQSYMELCDYIWEQFNANRHQSEGDQ